jgi:hypothetical protein
MNDWMGIVKKLGLLDRLISRRGAGTSRLLKRTAMKRRESIGL